MMIMKDKGSNPSLYAIVSSRQYGDKNPVRTSNAYLRIRLLSSLLTGQKSFYINKTRKNGE